MNERIKILAEQALEIVSNKRTLKDGQLERTWNPHEYDEVFAELIVRECAKLVEDNLDPQNAWITPGFIKDHFGVEE